MSSAAGRRATRCGGEWRKSSANRRCLRICWRARVRTLDIDDNLAEMRVRGLMPEGVGQLFQREMQVEDRTDAVRLDPCDHRERSEEHKSELQSLMRPSYAGFCLKKNNTEERRTQRSDKNTAEIEKLKRTSYDYK